MEWTARLDDQVSTPAERAAAGLDKTSTAGKALAAQLRQLDVAQSRSVRMKEAQIKAFNPDAYKRQIKAERDLGKAKEAALESLKLGLSQKEKDAAVAKTHAFERQRAAVGGLATAAKGAAMGLFAVAGASGAMNLAKVAIGYRGLERLQILAVRAQLNLRKMFKGVDSKPLEHSFARLTDLLNVATPTGKALSGILTRGFNSAFKTIEKATPYVEAFGQGLVLAALLGENAWLRLRIALLPVTGHLGRLVDRGTMLKAVAYGTVGAVGALGATMAVTAVIAGGRFAWSLGVGAKNAVRVGVSAARAVPGIARMGVAAAASALPFVAAAAAIGAWVAAIDQGIKLAKEWDTGVITRSFGFGKSDADIMNDKFDREAAERKASGKPSRVREVASLAELPAPPPPASIAASQETGAQMGQGVAKGMLSKVPDVERAGAALASAADRGVRKKAEIHSPSKLMMRDAERMGEGAEKGLEKSGPRVQSAAERSLVPTAKGRPGSGVGSGGSAGVSIAVDLSGSTFGAGLTAGDVRAQVEEAVAVLAQMLAARLAVAA